jgi:hypothetical protein
MANPDDEFSKKDAIPWNHGLHGIELFGRIVRPGFLEEGELERVVADRGFFFVFWGWLGQDSSASAFPRLESA